jgi:hypothetical protein
LITSNSISADIKKQLFIKVANKLRTAKLLPNYKHYEVGKHVINTLLKSKELNHITFEGFFNNPEEVNEVLETNVFAYYPEKDTVTFQSQLVECYVRKKANIFLK